MTSTGNGASVTSERAVKGAAPLSGNFRVSFRGAGICASPGDGSSLAACSSSTGAYPQGKLSGPIPFDATPAQMKAALEAVGSIDAVTVSRSGPTAENGYSWRVTFTGGTGSNEGLNAVRKLTPYGFMLDTVGNLLPLRPDKTELAGSGAEVRWCGDSTACL